MQLERSSVVYLLLPPRVDQLPLGRSSCSCGLKVADYRRLAGRRAGNQANVVRNVYSTNKTCGTIADLSKHICS